MDEKDLAIQELKAKVQELSTVQCRWYETCPMAEAEESPMTFDQLKAMAKFLGYNLVPIKKWVKKLPCTCGNKRFELHYYFGNKVFYKCPKCGKEGPRANGANNANIAWNDMITKEMEEGKG